MNIYTEACGRTPLEDLVIEMIYVAVQDYRKAQRIAERDPNCFITHECILATSKSENKQSFNHRSGKIMRPAELMKEIEDFFYSPFFTKISNLDPDEIVRLLRSNERKKPRTKVHFSNTDAKNEEVKNDPYCAGCIHYRKFNPSGNNQMCCHYWDDEDELRGCAPGKDCNKFDDNPKNLHRPELWEQSIKAGTLRKRRDR